MNCCACTNDSGRAFGAAVCQGGHCTDGTTACSLVSGVDFAMKDICP